MCMIPLSTLLRHAEATDAIKVRAPKCMEDSRSPVAYLPSIQAMEVSADKQYHAALCVDMTVQRKRLQTMCVNPCYI